MKGSLEKIIKTVLKKIRDRRDISDNTLDYFLVNNSKLGRYYLLPKIHKKLRNVPGRPVISNSGYYTENIWAFFEFHLKPLVQKVKSYIKDTNDFLRKIASLPPFARWHYSMHHRCCGLISKYPAWWKLDSVKKIFRIHGRQDNIYWLLNGFSWMRMQEQYFWT